MVNEVLDELNVSGLSEIDEHGCIVLVARRTHWSKQVNDDTKEI